MAWAALAEDWVVEWVVGTAPEPMAERTEAVQTALATEEEV